MKDLKKLAFVGVSAGAIVLAAATAVATGTSDDSDRAAHAPGAHSKANTEALDLHRLSGYPLDRSLDALVADSDSENIFLVESIASESPVDVTPKATAGPDSPPVTVVTPVSGRVTKVLRGSLRPGSSPTIPILGGRAGNVRVEASKELAPSVSSLTGKSGKILIAGKTSNSSKLGGEFVDPSFIYRVDEDGTVTSLLESAGDDPYPTFKLSDLIEALDK